MNETDTVVDLAMKKVVGDPHTKQPPEDPDVGLSGPANLEAFLKRLDRDIVELTLFVQALKTLDGRIATHLYGTDGVEPKVDDCKRGYPSFSSISNDMSIQLADLGRVIESLVKHVGPFDMDEVTEGVGTTGSGAG